MVNQTPPRGTAPRLRVVIAAAVAALLLGSSFYGAQAGNNSGYNDRLSGLEIAAIAVGAVGGGLMIASIVSDKDDDDDEASASKAKSAKASVTEVRVHSSQKQMTSGDTATVSVEAKYAGSNIWRNVTDKANVRLVSGGLTQVDGAKNAFAIPFGSSVVPGSALIEASFGGQSASTMVAVN